MSYCFRFHHGQDQRIKNLFSTSSPSVEIFSSYSLLAAFSSVSSRSSLNFSYCICIFSCTFLCMNHSCLLNQSLHFSRAKIASIFHNNDFLDLFSYCHSHNVLFSLFFSSNKQYFCEKHITVDNLDETPDGSFVF